MGILRRIGFAKQKARPVGQNLEKGLARPREPESRNLVIKGAIFALLVALTLAAFPRSDRYNYAVQVGDVWRQETIVAPYDFAIYKDADALRTEYENVRYSVEPIFRESSNALGQIAANRDTLNQQLERIFQAYASFRLNESRGRTEEAREDSLRYLDLRRNARLKATSGQWGALVNSYIQGLPEFSSTPGASRSNQRLDRRILNDAWELSAQLMQVGVMDVPLDSVYADQIIVRNQDENSQRYKPKENVYGLNEAYTYAQGQLEQKYDGDPELVSLAGAFFRAIFQPSLDYMRRESLQALQRKIQRISPTQGVVLEGTDIVRKGDVVTEETRRQLTSLERARSERSGAAHRWKVTLGQLLLTIATYLVFFLYLFLLRRQVFFDNRQILLVALLFAGVTGLYAIALLFPATALLIVPVAIVSVLLTVMFDSRVGLFGTMTLALIGGHLLNYDFEFAFATFFAGALAVFSVRDIKNRGQFFLSAGLVFVGYVLVLSASYLIYDTSLERLLSDLLVVGINAFLITMAYPLLWVFERAFDITTDLTLLELSDTNRPLLKELSIRAPGTFNHSLQVANLAEAGADAVGANALLTRVAALYHDIGKMLKPEYFVENQRPGDNPHDHLKPRMSALIIASHVKEGLEMGRESNLPQRVLKFIPMHHGTTRIEYFYQRAVQQRGSDDPPVQDSEFRYPGPRPDSKEAGILMLADSVEAASRSLSEPTHKRLEALVEMIFKARSEDGQLDDTELTFRDLSIIKETFLSLLLGIYHVRVKYPGQKDRIEKASESLVEAAPVASQGKTGEVDNVIGIPEQSVGVRSTKAVRSEAGVQHPSSEERDNSQDANNSRTEVQSTDEFNQGSADMQSDAAPSNDIVAQPDLKNGHSELDLDPMRRARQDTADNRDASAEQGKEAASGDGGK